MQDDRADEARVTAWALRAGAGDRAAATRFVEATRLDLHRFLAHLVDPPDVEDIAQETYLRAMRALPRFAARSSARTWLLAIARRAAADHVRTLVRRPRIAAHDDWQAAAEAVDAGGGSPVEEAVVLRRLLQRLPVERREAFIATQLVGLSYAEAADVCDCPIGTIRSRVARAREDLVAALGAQRGEGRHLRAI